MADIRTVSLRRKLVKLHTTRRRAKAIDYLREDIARHSNTVPGSVSISGELNSYLMRNLSGQMPEVKISVEKTGDIVKADLAPELKKQAAAIREPAKAADKGANKDNAGAGKSSGRDNLAGKKQEPAKKEAKSKSKKASEEPGSKSG